MLIDDLLEELCDKRPVILRAVWRMSISRTGFSNKQAKLLKSQKFPAELDQLVDTTKVKMDVIRPWIATRATELLGFEDEVLINFIYDLLDGKAVDGKAIQIQITGFMEKNTGKFMKELWILLLSAQMNASGVPQQFLDAKEEEMKKKKVETDRIALEIRSRREKEERERGKPARMDGEAEFSNLKSSVREASQYSDGEREADGRHGRRSNNRDGSKSRSESVSSLSQRQSISPEMGIKSSRRRSISVSRRDRSPPRLSTSPRRRPSPQRVHSPSRRGSSPRFHVSPRRRLSPEIGRSPLRKSRRRSGSNPRYRSPSPSRRRSPRVRRRSPFLHRRSPSPARGKSPSPPRRRSPVRRRSPSPSRRRSPVRRRSPSPSRRRSPVRRRSPTPSRRRSPVRRKSPSPSRRRSPVRRRSPTPPRRRSPVRRRSPTPPRRRSPVRRRSPSPLRRRSPPPRSLKRRHSPSNNAANSQLSPRQRKRSLSPYGSRSPAYRDRRNLSREHDNIANGVESKWTHGKKSPSYYASDRDVAERPDSGYTAPDAVSHRLPTSLMSPQRNTRDQSGNHDMLPVMPQEKSPEQSKSPIHAHKTTSRRDRSLSASPVKHTREQRRHFDSPESNGQDGHSNRAREESYDMTRSLHRKGKDLPADEGLKKIHETDFSPEVYSTEKSKNQSPSKRRNATTLELRKDTRERRDMELAERHVRKVSPSPVAEDAPRNVKERFYSVDAREKHQATKQQAIPASSVEVEYDEQVIKHSGVGGSRVSEDSRCYLKSEGNVESQDGRSKAKLDRSNLLDTISSDTETDTYTKKRKHSKSDRNKKHVGDDSESESGVDDRKMAKRRRKEEKRLRKEVRRRRREERHHRKSERRAGKLAMKSANVGAPPSDMDNDLNVSDKSDGDSDTRMVSHSSDTEPESEQKKLEIELRKKALESLRAKKAISD